MIKNKSRVMKKYLLLIIFFARLTITNAQNVGIGTTTPSLAKLEVHGAGTGASKTSGIFGSNVAGISFQRDLPTIGFNQYYPLGTGYGRYMASGYGGAQYLDPITGNLFFDLYPSGLGENDIVFARRLLTLNSSGKVSIGDAYTNSTLTIAKETTGVNTATFAGSTYNSVFNFGAAENTYIRAGKNGGIVFINDIPGGKISLNGFIGINTATPVYPLELRQAFSDRGLLLVEENTFANWNWFVTPNGDLNLNYAGTGGMGYFKKTDGSYHSISDRRLKKDIETLPSLLNKFLQLQPVSYQMRNDKPGQKKSIGFIAQDVRKLFPELVTVSSDTTRITNGIADLHMLNYDGFNILTIKAIQEQQGILQKQKASIAIMHTKREAMKKVVAALKK